MKHFILLSAIIFSITSAIAQSGPNGIGTDNIFWYKASDLGLSNGTLVSNLADKTSNNLDATQSDNNKQPTFSTNPNEQINSENVVVFNGNSFLEIPSHLSINIGNSYERKAISIVFRTSTEINTTQVIFEEGGRVTTK